MKKEIREVNKELGILRITTLNERWYSKPSVDETTGLPIYTYLPSSTWIASYYPKGIGFYKWLAEKGWDEAEALKQAAGDKGSKVHYVCSDIDLGKDVGIEDKYLNPSTGQEEELTIEEVDCVISYAKFVDDYKPILLGNELTGFGDGYAGTIDKIFAIGELKPGMRQIWILDIKSGKSIWREHELQISSYSHLEIDYKSLGITDEEWKNRKLAILQVGYRLNKNRYKFNEIKDVYEMFKNVAYPIWQMENPNVQPNEKDYPLVICSQFRKETRKVAAKEIKKAKK